METAKPEGAKSRLAEQMEFLLEIDKLKAILRQSLLTAERRRENSAEHSWHLCMMVLVLSEYANQPIDTCRALKMALVHDLVEIDAGDTYCYDVAANADKAEREQRAAERIFGLLPAAQARELRALWDEFEARETPESRFANAVDRLQPMLLNYHTEGRAWIAHEITLEQVLTRNQPIEDGAAALWEYAKVFIRDAVDKGYLRTSE